MHNKKGKSAYRFYQDWFIMRHHSPPSKDSFINSRYFTSFMKFVDYQKKMAIPNVKEYIKLMVSLKMLPHSWTNKDAYEYYINKYDSNVAPLKQAEHTIETLVQLSNIFECDLKNSMEELDGNDMIKLIQAKKLSPWILLFSKKFFNFLLKDVTTEQRIIIQTLINTNKWKRKFQTNPKAVRHMKKIVKELEI